MLIRRRAIEFEGNVQESEKVYYAHEDLKTLLNKIKCFAFGGIDFSFRITT